MAEKITLWMPVSRPSYIMYEAGNVVEVGMTLTADEVYCDLCNAVVPLRPVPVVRGYALCLECLDQLVPDWHKLVDQVVVEEWRRQLESE